MFYNDYVLKNAEVFLETGFVNKDIHVVNGVIKAVEENIVHENIVECSGKIITPGFIDVHIHLRDPGFLDKETIKSGSLAALHGGYTTAYAMPNTFPTMDNVDVLKKFNDTVARDTTCDVKTFVGVSIGLNGEKLTDIETLGNERIAGFSDDGYGVQDDNMMLEAMKKIQKTGHILSVHSEDESELGEVMGCVHDGHKARELGLIGINSASEYKMVARDLKLVRETGVKYHVCHVSTVETVDLIKNAKAEGLDVSCEVTPHHLVLTEENVTMDTMWKMNPPLRRVEDNARLIEGLNNGDIEVIATDHAPHTKKEKERHISKAPFGIVGLESAFSVLNTYLVNTNKVELKTILNAMTYNPAKRFNEERGIKVGMDANMVVLDLNEKIIVTGENTYSKSSNSPFYNQELTGCVCMTIQKENVYDWKNL